jgi:cell division septal protein FtsQ
MSTRVSTGLLDRRKTVIARRHQRRRTTLLVIVVVAALLAGGWWIATGPLLRVSQVNIFGYSQVDQSRIARTVQIAARSGTMLQLPTVAVREALASSPWVEGVEVHHNWPKAIDVRITQATPIAVAIAEDGSRLLISESGRVLGESDLDTALPTFQIGQAAVGSWLSRPSLRAPFQLISAMDPEVARRVKDLRMEGGLMRARLEDGLEIRLGPPTLAWQKGRALEAMLTAALATEDLAASQYIDLTVPGKPMLGGTRDDGDESQSEVETATNQDLKLN